MGSACCFPDFGNDGLRELLEDFVFGDALEVSLSELIDDLMSEFDFQLAVSSKETVKRGTVEREFNLVCGVVIGVLIVLGET